MAVTRELIIFLYFILGGVVGGIFLDLLRVLRKNRKVCEGCKYRYERNAFPLLAGGCNYMGATGESRMRVEEENGGFQKDSCCCYEEGKNKKNKERTMINAEKNNLLSLLPRARSRLPCDL